MSEDIYSKRIKTLEFLQWVDSVRKVEGVFWGVKLGAADGIAEDVLLLLELKEQMTLEEWENFLRKEFRLRGVGDSSSI